MSKKPCENQSGATLAAAILDKSRGKFSEKANVNRDYEKIFKRNFTSDFLKYYKLITNNKIQFGKLTKEQFDDLQKQLVQVTRKYCIDDLCQWFRVEKWQDLFPNDYENRDELNFKEEMYKLIIDFYKMQEQENEKALKDKEEQNEIEKDKIEKSEKEEVKNGEEQEKIVKNKTIKVKKDILKQYENDMIKVKEMIYDLMKTDYTYQYQKKYHNSKNEMILNIAKVERDLKNLEQMTEQIKEQLINIEKKREEKENQQMVEAIEIINHINLGIEPEEKSSEFKELYRKCKENYFEEKIDFAKINILEWVNQQREEMSE